MKKLEELNVNGTVAIVAHDAGGAEVTSSFARAAKWNCIIVSDGPARAIFRRKFPDHAVTDLPDAIERCDWVFCGTSWQSDLEVSAIRYARKAGKRVVAFLDHWTNFGERFTRDDDTSLPDEIWVGDAYALEVARSVFDGIPIILVDNVYLREVVAEVERMTPQNRTDLRKTRVLYVCEPISEHGIRRLGNPEHWGYTEYSALEYFLASTNVLGCEIDRIVIRPHPAEAPDKYNWAMEKCAFPITISKGPSLAEDIAACDVVVGCNSMAMAIAVLAGRRVISCIPPGGRGFVLPHRDIEWLARLNDAAETLKPPPPSQSGSY